jgi:argininosuccinate lyase
VAELLAFDTVSPNSLDAVSDRDYIIEFLSAGSLISMHLSRLAEEFILWNSPEFGFIELDDSVTTGSSIMPQKKNPDVAELARGKTGRIFGHLMGVLTVMKGLPLAYNKDTQEDKEPLFDTIQTLELLIPAFERMLSTARFNRERMAASLKGDFSTATDLADWLVRQGLPFREAHERIAALVRNCISRGIGLEDLGKEELAQAIGMPKADLQDISAAASIAARKSVGGTAPEAVRTQLRLAQQALS